jgi:hypothetical protein
LTANTFENRIGVRLYLRTQVADQALALLTRDRDQIEREIGAALEWNPNPGNQDKIIVLHRPADLSKQSEWPQYIAWMTKSVIAFRKAFQNRIKNLDLTVPVDEEVEA